jgi:hypothetical protein
MDALIGAKDDLFIEGDALDAGLDAVSRAANLQVTRRYTVVSIDFDDFAFDGVIRRAARDVFPAPPSSTYASFVGAPENTRLHVHNNRWRCAGTCTVRRRTESSRRHQQGDRQNHA